MKSDRIQFIVIDDEKPAREILTQELQAQDQIEVIASCATADEAFQAIVDLRPDAVFLDIELKRGNAFDLITRLKKAGVALPAIVIMTGHSEFEYGVKSIEHRDCIIKILQKPFWEGFDDELESIKDLIYAYHQQDETDSGTVPDVQFVKFNNRTVRMEYREILFLEVAGSGCTLAKMSHGELITISRTMNQLLATLPDYILRVSRFNAVNINKITSIDHIENMIYLQGQDKAIGYSKNFYQVIGKRLGLR